MLKRYRWQRGSWHAVRCFSMCLEAVRTHYGLWIKVPGCKFPILEPEARTQNASTAAAPKQGLQAPGRELSHCE